MCDTPTLIDHVGNLDPAEAPGIERLTSGRGIERGSVEVDSAPFVCAIDHRRLEIPQVRVGIIESVRHGEPGGR
jgi:hypothetical protein